MGVIFNTRIICEGTCFSLHIPPCNMGAIFSTYVLWERTILAIINIVLPRHSAGVIFNTRVFQGTCFSLHIPLDNMGVILSTPASLFG